MIPSFMAGGAVYGGLVMAFGVGQLAPHGGIWVLPLIGHPIFFVIALAAGMVVSAALILFTKQLGKKPAADAVEQVAPVVAAGI